MSVEVECWYCKHVNKVQLPQRKLGVKCEKCGNIIPYPPLPL